MATIKFNEVNKVYDNKFHAVHDFSMEIKDKEFVVFVGPSGCGKSTTLRMIAGFEDITSGEIFIDDTKINTLAPKDRNIAMVFQNYALYPHMTVFDNMAFALKLRKAYLPVTSLDEDDPQYQAEIKQAIEASDAETNATIEQMKLEKKGRDQIKEYLFRRRTDLIAELEAIDARYEKPVLTFDTLLTDDLEKQLQEAKKANDLDAVKSLKEQLEAAYNDLTHPAYTLRHYTSHEIAAKVNETAKILGLEPYLKRKPAALSGGQRQRVALGRAIVRNPKVFLMDEPLSNLDAKLRVQTRSEIIKIHRKVGATTIYVTHDQTEAMTMADRIVIMSDGVVQQIGTPKEVYETPSNIFVAGFIGSPSMNFLKGTFDGKNFVFDEGAGTLKLSKKDIQLLKGYEDKKLVMGVRPEHLYLADDKTVENKSEKFPVTIDIDELLGSEIIVYGYMFNQKVLLKISSKSEIKQGEKVNAVFDDDCVHFFDEETGKAIR